VSELLISHRHQRGFTLIELLVVLAIIGLLVAILIPGLMMAQNAGNELTCKSRMDQLFKSIFLFVDQDDEHRLPTMGRGTEVIAPRFHWLTQTANVLGILEPDLYVCPVDDSPMMARLMRVKGTAAWYIPEKLPDGVGNKNLIRRQVRLSYRGSCDTMDPDAPKGRPITDFKEPSEEFMLIEGIVFPHNRCMRTEYLYLLAEPDAANTIRRFDSWVRHSGTTNVLFMDGHVDRLTPRRVGETAINQQYGGLRE